MPDYLLPCRCGRTTRVRTNQAGQTVQCGCGQPLEVPTLLQLTRLEPAPAEDAAAGSRPTWNLRHGLILLGALLLAACLPLGVWIYWHRPEALLQRATEELRQTQQSDAEQIVEVVDGTTPRESMMIWEFLRRTDFPKDPKDVVDPELMRHARLRYKMIMVSLLAGVVLAAALIGVGLYPRKKSSN